MTLSRLNRLGAAAAAAFLSIAGTARADSAQPTQQELLDMVRTLQAKVTDLQNGQQQTRDLAEKAIVDKTIADIEKDVARQSQLMADGGFTAGYDKGKFLIQSADGNFVFHPNAQLLFRHTTTYREDGKGGGTSEDIQNGFEVRRMKFGIDGNIISKDLNYNFLWATDRKTGNLVLEEAWAVYKFSDSLSIKGGQYKNYFTHEALSSSKRLFSGERTYLNNVFVNGDDFVQGVALLYEEGPVKAAISYTDGGNGPNQNFQDFPTTKANFGIAGRAEYKAMGDWKSYEDFTALGNKSDLLVLGAGFDYTEAGSTGTLGHTIDAQYEVGKFSAYAAYLARLINDGDEDRYDYGGLIQGGYLVTDKMEPFARYSYIHFDNGSLAAGLEQDVHEISVGFNYYFSGHNAKLTTDFTWLPNGVPVSGDGAGFLASPDGGDQFVLRVQFQLLI